MNPQPIHFLLIDLFCGAGGTTTGAEKSGVCKVIAAVNHDPMAIKSHAAISQAAAYLGFEAAEQYAESMRGWYDYEAKYKGCRLDETYQQFLDTEKETFTIQTATQT